jgi:hypothetical protein
VPGSKFVIRQAISVYRQVQKKSMPGILLFLNHKCGKTGNPAETQDSALKPISLSVEICN